MRCDGSVPAAAGPWVLRLALAGLVALAGLAVAVPTTEAQGGGATATVEVRVWQHVEDGRNIHVNVRAVGGAWASATAVPLAEASGSYSYGEIPLDVPLAGRAAM